MSIYSSKAIISLLPTIFLITLDEENLLTKISEINTNLYISHCYMTFTNLITILCMNISLFQFFNIKDESN